MKANLLVETFVFLLRLLSEKGTNTLSVGGVQICERPWGEAKKLGCCLAHNFLLNQKELGKHKHGWVMLSHGVGVGTDFLFLSVSLPACELDPSFLLINKNRVKCLLVSWRKSLPWRMRSNLATIFLEEKYWQGLLWLKTVVKWDLQGPWFWTNSFDFCVDTV